MKPHILIVDDEEQNLELAKIILLKEGYSLHFAQNGEEAIECINNNTIDVMVLDLFMPKMDGFETLAKIRSNNTILSIIVVTAYTDEESHIRAIELGADDVMTKPYDIIELKQRVKKILTPQQIKEKLYAYEQVELITNSFLDELGKLKKEFKEDELIKLFKSAISRFK